MTPGQALRTISAAASRAFAGDVIVVGPGQYNEAIINPPSGEAGRLLTFLGDPTGRLTGDVDIAGAVIVDAGGGQRAAFSLADRHFVIIEGFTVTGGTQAGIEVRSNSSNITIRNCESFDNPDNGILVRDSSSVLLFNNLVVRNNGNGIIAGGTAGSEDVQVVNNTIANNGDRGIRVGEGSVPTTNVSLQNNIIQDNDGAGVQANQQSVETLQVSFNLVFPENYIPQQVRGANDINEDAELIGADDYHLTQATSPAVDAGDPSTSATFANALGARTTDPAGTRDMGRVDLGYHFPIN
jgi:parallel beta-helix repeat protein